jgi:polysaccharide deacetylase family protein (PEP-CTERM system associated)
MKPGIRNAMTVDVEDYFQVQAFAGCIDRAAWHRIAPRVEANVDRILDQFAAAEVNATFFTLGWIAERHKPMVRRIVAAGHELASHGYDHTRADAQDPATFQADVSRTRLLLEDIGGVAVRGYRSAHATPGPSASWRTQVTRTAPASTRSSTTFMACPMPRGFRSVPTAAGCGSFR